MIEKNLLGRMLAYVTRAKNYAAQYEPREKAQSTRNIFDRVLRAQGQQDEHDNLESVDTDAAYKLAMCSEWVYSDLKLIGDRVASTKFEVKQRKGDELDDLGNHAFEDLWANPQGVYSSGLLSRYLTWWLNLRGNAFMFVVTPTFGAGEPTELQPLIASKMQPLPATIHQSKVTGRPIVDYDYKLNPLAPTRLPGEHVVHFRNPNPFDYWEGLSPLNAIITTIETDISARRWQRNFFRDDNAVPLAVVSLASELGDSDYLTAVADIKDRIADGNRLLFARAGDMSVEAIQQTLQDLEFNVSREFNREAIDRVYGIPQGLVSGGLSGDSRQAAEITFARNCIQPLLDYMADELTAKVAPFYGEGIVITAPNVIPQDRALELQEYQTYAMDRTINENRSVLEMDDWEPPKGLAEAMATDLDLTVLAGVPVRILDIVATRKRRQEAYGDDSPEQGGAEQPETTGEEEEPEGQPGTPSMAGQQAPEQQVNEAAQKAAMLGIETEMGRWEKVALKEIREGRNPAERAFESDILPLGLREGVAEALEFADTEEAVKAAFEAPFFRQGRP